MPTDRVGDSAAKAVEAKQVLNNSALIAIFFILTSPTFYKNAFPNGDRRQDILSRQVLYSLTCQMGAYLPEILRYQDWYVFVSARISVVSA